MGKGSGSGFRAAYRADQRGFTLVELVVTIIVGSVVVAFMSMFIVTPMLAYTAQTRRAQLVDAADSALRFMGRDLRAALPNSVRAPASGAVALEFLNTLDGARYADGGPLASPAVALNFTAAATAFSTTVPFTQHSLPWSLSAYLAIYNVGVPGANAYEMANPGVMTPLGSITVSAGATPNQNLVTFPSFPFAYGSPGKRVYLVSGPVSYLCDTVAGTLTRYSGYGIMSSQPVSAATLLAAGATASLVSGNVGACAFTYTSGTAQRNALVTLTLQLVQSGESVQLLYEVPVLNSP